MADKELLLRCDCGGDHFIALRAWLWDQNTDDPDRDFLVEVLDCWKAPRGWFGRIRAAVQVLFKSEFHAASVSPDAAKLRAIAAWCEETAIP